MRRYLLPAFLLLSSMGFAKDEPASSVQAEIENAKQAISILREKMRDPDSLVVEHVYAKMNHETNHPLMCIPYRAKNGFGGYSNNIAEYKGGTDINPDAGTGLGWCMGVERNWSRRSKKGWADITEEYKKEISSSASVGSSSKP